MKRQLLSILTCILLATLPLQAQQLIQQIGLPNAPDALYGKRQFSYADSGYFYLWNNGQWEMFNIQEYVYNTQNQKTKTFEKSPQTGQVINEANYTYNAAGQVLMVYTETFYNGKWEPLLEERSVYDAKNNRTSFVVEQYNLVQKVWNVVYGDSFDFTYGVNDRIEAYTLYQQTNNGVNPYQRLTWSDFDANDMPKTLEVESYINGFQKYLKLDQIQWKDGYDYAQFDPSLYYGYSWDGTNWNPAAYDSSVYVNNQRVRKILFNWDGSTLDTASRVDYRYDAKGHKLETVSYQKVGAGWSLTDGSQDSIVYGFDDVTLERYFRYFDKNNGTWANQEKQIYHYNKLGIQAVKSEPLSFYPNPASKEISLDFEATELHVLAMDGKRLQLQKTANGTWDVSKLQAGVYVLQARNQQSLRVARLAIQ